MKLQIVFQSKTNADGAEGSSASASTCTPGKILLNAGDMKKLQVRLGAYVLVTLLDTDTSMLCRAWQSKKPLPGGSATLHKVWMPNFTDQSRAVNVTAASSEEMITAVCEQVCMTVSGTDSVDEEVIRSKYFAAYVHTLLVEVPLASGLEFGATYRGDPFFIKVHCAVLCCAAIAIAVRCNCVAIALHLRCDCDCDCVATALRL
jgi:hypothetical protein